MKHSTRKLTFLAVAAAILTTAGCKDDPISSPPPLINTGSANFTTYVALGNSLTAGYQSSALSQRDQPWSYPNLIAKGVQISFEQPLIKDPGIGGRLRLVNLVPTIVSESSVNPADPASNLNAALQRPYNNLGIPGSVVFDMLDETDFAAKSVQRKNPFFAQILRTSTFGKSIVAQTRALKPTFITLWIGNNDVLGYATSGGSGAPTSPAIFNALYRGALDSLRTIGAGIVVANIPDVSAIPFFTTIGPSIAAALPSGVALWYQENGNRGPATRSTRLNTANEPLLTLAGSSYASLLGRPTGQYYRDAAIRLGVPVSAVIGAGIDTTKPFALHPQNPWPDPLTLDLGEQAVARTAVAAFNTIIDTLARNRNIAVVDFHAFLNKLSTEGINVPGIGTFTSAFIRGGAFSYDGVHPSSRGQALVANEWIKVINAKFNASISPVPISSAPGIPIGKIAVGEQPQLPSFSPGAFDDLINLLNMGRPWR